MFEKKIIVTLIAGIASLAMPVFSQTEELGL